MANGTVITAHGDSAGALEALQAVGAPLILH
jgi:hypothetical protein